MGIQNLQKFIELHCPNACVPVDLLKIARSVVIRRGGGARRGGIYGQGQGMYGPGGGGGPSRLCLVVDGESCLDRLYGGYFSDWVCGGQWNRMVQYLAVLIQTIRSNDIELAVFFNGGLESQRLEEWIRNQQNERKKITQVLKHVESKGTPPPKVWWVPPVCLVSSIRMALRHLNVSVISTIDDHHQEVIVFCRENNFHGLLAEDAEYAIFDPPRYFSSEQLKLTYKGSLETKEFILEEVAKQLDLHPSRFCLFAALLGNYLLTEEMLVDFYTTVCPESKGKAFSDALITAICNFVRSLPSIDNLDGVGAQVFGSGAKGAGLTQKLKECVQYYVNGTKDGYLRYRPPLTIRKPEPGHYVPTWFNVHSQSPNSAQASISLPNTARFASEAQDSELTNYQESAVANPQIVIEPPTQGIASNAKTDVHNTTNGNTSVSLQSGNGIESSSKNRHSVNGTLQLSSSSSSTSSPSRLSPEANWNASQKNPEPSSAPGGYPYNSKPTVRIPSVPLEVIKTASERHQKGLMTTWIYQVLTQGEIRIPLCLEDDVPNELPSSALLYRPVRQMIYAVLFNLHHLQFQTKQKAEQTTDTSPPVPDILVKEWVWTKHNQYRTPDLVKAEPLGWAVPTVQRLWFGATVDDKKRRMRAFLTCMNCDTPFMLNATYVPQHLLIMCCILRYILSRQDLRILRRHELNAFLAMAVSPQLMDAQAMQSVQLPVVTSRGVQLASLFMRGVEVALFANDACGSPIPWLTCCPWLFFDGKLFHYKLLKAEEAKNLIDLCEGQTDQVLKVERMRQAILKGLKVEFARPPLPVSQIPPNRIHNAYGHPPMNFIPAGAPWPMPNRGRTQFNNGRRPVLARGGQLEIAGVVVGSWGPNYGTSHRTPNRTNTSVHMAPQVTSVGGPRRFRFGNSIGLVRGGMPSYGIKRPPPRIRRPLGNQNHNQVNVRKVKRTTTKVSTVSTPSDIIEKTKVENHVEGGTEVVKNEIDTQNDDKSVIGDAEKETNVETSSNSVKNEDDEEAKVNTSPIIMKKPLPNAKEIVIVPAETLVDAEKVAQEE